MANDNTLLYVGLGLGAYILFKNQGASAVPASVPAGSNAAVIHTAAPAPANALTTGLTTLANGIKSIFGGSTSTPSASNQLPTGSASAPVTTTAGQDLSASTSSTIQQADNTPIVSNYTIPGVTDNTDTSDLTALTTDQLSMLAEGDMISGIIFEELA